MALATWSFLVSYDKIYRSIDSGLTWELNFTHPTNQEFISIKAIDNGVVLAGTDNGRVFRSDDFGESYSGPINLGEGIYIRDFLSLGNGVVLAATGYEAAVLKSTDDGLTWNTVLEPALGETTNVRCLCEIVGAEGEALCGLDNSKGIYKTTDYGSTWAALTTHCGEEYVMGLVAYSNGTYVAATGNAGRIRRTTDGGTSWSTSIDMAAPYVQDIIICEGPDNYIMSGNYYGFIHVSDDYGASFANPSTGGDTGESVIRCLEPIANGVDGSVLIGTGTNGKLFRTTDYGETLSLVFTSSYAYITQISTVYGEINGSLDPEVEEVWLPAVKNILPRETRSWDLHPEKELKDFFRALMIMPKGVLSNYGLVLEQLYPEYTTMLREWSDQFGYVFDLTKSEIADEWKYFGGQDPDFIQTELQKINTNLYVHQWWVPSSDPVEARNPFLYMDDSLVLVNDVYDMRPNYLYEFRNDSDPDVAEFTSEEGANFGHSEGLFKSFKAYPCPNDPVEYPSYWYVCDETWPDPAVITEDQLLSVMQLIFKLKPTNTRCLLRVITTDSGEPIIDSVSGDEIVSDEENVKIFGDNFYTSGTVEICDNASYSSATIKITQSSIDSWSDEEIQLDIDASGLFS